MHKKGMNSVGEKIARNDNKLLLYITRLGHLVKTTTWFKILECHLMKNS